MQKIVVTREDIAQTDGGQQCDSPGAADGKPTNRPWLRFLLLPLVLIPPLLCIVALALMAALRSRPAAIRSALNGYLCWLLIASGLLGSVGVAALYYKRVVTLPLPSSLGSLDAAPEFPAISGQRDLPPPEIAGKLRRLVFVVVSDYRAAMPQQRPAPVQWVPASCCAATPPAISW